MSSVVTALTFSLLLRRNCQPKNRNLPRPRHIQTTRLFRIRQIKCLAMFAAIDFCIASPSLLHISASLLEHIGCVEPAFEMPTAKLAFLILLVASPLSRLLDFDLVLGELRRSLCPRGYACRQKVHPSSSGSCRRQIELRTSHSTRSLLPDARSAERPGRRGSCGAKQRRSQPQPCPPQSQERQGQSTLASKTRHRQIPSYLPEAATDEPDSMLVILS